MTKDVESTYQAAMEQITGGKHVSFGFYGVTDITTDKFHAELKNWHCWKSVIGQLLTYNIASSREELRAYFFGKRPAQSKIDKIVTTLQTFKISAFSISLDSRTACIEDLNTKQTHIIKDVNLPITDNYLTETDKLFISKVYSLGTATHHIKLDDVSKLIGGFKPTLVLTLKQSYTENVDYIISKTHKRNNAEDPYCNNYKQYLLNLNSFNKVCMLSHSKKGALVRAYILQHQSELLSEESDILVKTS